MIVCSAAGPASDVVLRVGMTIAALGLFGMFAVMFGSSPGYVVAKWVPRFSTVLFFGLFVIVVTALCSMWGVALP